ncbi:MAG: CBS domain-containing protein [Parcubacteria group bacterium]|nr:CBS domain-containing protein [Parcubacteria group bacterium]
MFVREIMTKDLIAVRPDLPLIDAAQTMFEKKFNGLPVVDQDNKLVGLITQQDLILRTHAVHLPTLIDLLSQIGVYKQNSTTIKEDLHKIISLKVSDVMNKNPVIISEKALVAEAAELFANHHAVNPIPVVTQDGKLSGIISRFDVLKFFVGGSSVHASIDRQNIAGNPQVENFIHEFEKRFLFVSKGRTQSWFWIGLGLALVGFFVAWSMILRVTIQ